MKKLCLILLLFSYISVIPAFAAKVIVNDTNDRRVPSRSSGPDAFVQYYEVGDDYVESSYYGSNSNHGYQLEKYKNENLPLLKEDFRLELVGTTWHYPDNYTTMQQISNNELNEIIDANEINHARHREAADYYTKDTIKDPSVLVPCGNFEAQ